MTQHAFKVHLKWRSGKDHVGQLEGDVIHAPFSIPNALGGVGVGTNPDELLISAAGSCFTLSLAATLERARIDVIALDVNSVGTVSYKNHKFSMENITHNVNIYVQNVETKDQLNQRLERLIHIADRNCMVSNSIRGNVAIHIHPSIII